MAVNSPWVLIYLYKFYLLILCTYIVKLLPFSLANKSYFSEMPVTRKNAALKAIQGKRTTRSTVARAEEVEKTTGGQTTPKVSPQGHIL